MATSIFFSGRLISVPGAYSEIDASGLESIGLGASGIVALLGTSIGGKPWTEIGEGDVKGELQVTSQPAAVNKLFREGDLREGAPLLFGPSNDADIQGGAQEIVFVKVNPATQSAASFDNVDGESLILTSADWGFFTTQIKVDIATGTTQGKMLTITFETTEEVFDDVGGDTIFELLYLASTPADGFTTVTAEIDAARIKTLFTRDQIGLDSEVTTTVTPTQVIELVSSSASDVAVVVRIYGTDTSDATQSALVTLTGVTAVDTTETWNEYHGAEIVSGTLVGTLTIRNDGAGTTLSTIAPAGTEAAVEFTIDHAVAGTAITLVADAALATRATVFGLSNTGVFQTEVFVMNGTTPVPGVALWSRLDGLAYGAIAAARTITASGTSVDAVFSGLSTIQKLADKYNGTAGYTFTVSVSNPTAYPGTDLDFQAAASILSPAKITATGDLAAIIAKLAAESSLVVGTKGSVASGAPDNTSATVFLTGGHEGDATAGNEGVPTTTSADWQGGLDLLKKVRINTVCAITGDPAVHANVKAHCEYMGGVGRSERDTVLGALNAALTDVPTKAEFKSQAVDLNTRHARLVGQAIERFDTRGDRVERLPPFTSLIVAGMQAGSPVGTSLTHKFANVLKLRQSATWNPVDDAEELIQAGLCMLELIDGVGRRVVRNVTTHLTDNNIAFSEASVNEAVNFAVFNFRSAMEQVVGTTGFSGTARAAQGVAINQLGLLVGVALVAWRSLDVQLVLDVLQVAVEMAPVLPVNFVENTIHLVAIPQSAAA